ncbi:MAG: tRNA (adenosine(37)-N6)-threonylcarbamoyltransferase complex ATPase subunit type 1 TsaE [Dermatophilus congolensis]|nr:tRNA (adenosine(37)-N6)-threonylcarbamoyltransferase complex ATPase subunit type 1 TsaE [Dermatophilus congolensis]
MGSNEVPDSVTVDLVTADDTYRFGARLARLLNPGDLVLLVGDLGAGKTTLTQGLGDGLNVRGPVASPTFVISRVHPSLGDGPALVHVDAYRLGDHAELDDLDLDADMDSSVTVVEWGAGIAEGLAEDYLVIELQREVGGAGGATTSGDGTDDDTDPRRVHVHGVGERWAAVDLSVLATQAD